MGRVKQMATKMIETKNCEFSHLLGERVFLMCSSYFYVGTLTEVHAHSVVLTGASIVYETGKWDAPTWADAQKLPFGELRIRRASIESYAKSTK